MVSGFLTSPLDQERMASGEATEIATYSTWFTLSRPSNSRALSLVLIILFYFGGQTRLEFTGLKLLCSNRRQCRVRLRRLVNRVGITDLHVQTERLHFLHQHIEGFRHTGFEAVVAFDDAFVNARAALHVVGLDG